MTSLKRAVIISTCMFSATVLAQDEASKFNSYETACVIEQEVQTKRSLDLSSEEFILGQTIFLDEACEQAAYSFDYTGSFTRPEAQSIDWFLEKALTPESELIANAFIQNRLYGLTE